MLISLTVTVTYGNLFDALEKCYLTCLLIVISYIRFSLYRNLVICRKACFVILNLGRNRRLVFKIYNIYLNGQKDNPTPLKKPVFILRTCSKCRKFPIQNEFLSYGKSYFRIKAHLVYDPNQRIRPCTEMNP